MYLKGETLKWRRRKRRGTKKENGNVEQKVFGKRKIWSEEQKKKKGGSKRIRMSLEKHLEGEILNEKRYQIERGGRGMAV